MKQNCWGNDTYCWGSEAICVGETPQIQSEGYPDQTRPGTTGHTVSSNTFPGQIVTPEIKQSDTPPLKYTPVKTGLRKRQSKLDISRLQLLI